MSRLDDYGHVLQELELPLLEKAFLLALLGRCGVDLECSPTYEALAEDAGASRRSAIVAIKRLRARGLLEVTSRAAGTGTSVSNGYRLILRQGPAST